MAAVRLSTIDNPFNPFTEWYDWLVWDHENGYNSCEMLDDFAKTSKQFTDQENKNEIERAIDEIIANDLTGMRCRVVEGQEIPFKNEKIRKLLAKMNK